MVVSNAQHETAIVIRRDGSTVVFVRFKPGKLACERLTEQLFRDAWHETACPLPQAVDQFLDHAQLHGGTQEALKGLIRLQERERLVVASLF